MLCKDCGAELTEGAKFCPKCGKPVTITSATQNPAPAQSLASRIQNQPEAKNDTSHRKLLKLLLVIGMACFFFPFVTVSCSGETADISGADAMLATFIAEEYRDAYDYAPNPYLLAAFGLGIAGLVIAWKNKKLVIAGYISLIGAIALFLFRTTFMSFYELDGYESMIGIKFRWGWLLSLLAYLAAAIIALQPLKKLSDKGIISFGSNKPPEGHSDPTSSDKSFRNNGG